MTNKEIPQEKTLPMPICATCRAVLTNVDWRPYGANGEIMVVSCGNCHTTIGASYR